MAPKSKKLTFKAKIIFTGGGGAYVEFPYDVEKTFGTRGRVKIKATIDGEPYRGSLVNMGTGCHILIVLKAIREKIGKGEGDTVTVVLEQDTAERTVELPADFKKALGKNKAAKDFFEHSSYTNRKEYVNWIESAKRPETRAARLAQALDRLAHKLKFS